MRILHESPQLPTRPCTMRLGASACTVFVTQHTRRGDDGLDVEIEFTIELFRLDKSDNASTLMAHALSRPEHFPSGADGGPRHVVIANTGLHFSDSYANETELFQQQLTLVASMLHEFNAVRNGTREGEGGI